MAILGIGSVITAIIGSRLPVVKNVNSKVLTGFRFTAGATGTVELAAGLAALGYSLYKYKNNSERGTDQDIEDRPEQEGSSDRDIAGQPDQLNSRQDNKDRLEQESSGD